MGETLGGGVCGVLRCEFMLLCFTHLGVGQPSKLAFDVSGF